MINDYQNPNTGSKPLLTGVPCLPGVPSSPRGPGGPCNKTRCEAQDKRTIYTVRFCLQLVAVNLHTTFYYDCRRILNHVPTANVWPLAS